MGMHPNNNRGIKKKREIREEKVTCKILSSRVMNRAAIDGPCAVKEIVLLKIEREREREKL
jgi:hypothetical protein